MSIIGVTVGTPTSPKRIENEIKPVKTVNGKAPDENGNVEVVGKDGKSAYEVAVANGFDGTEKEWLASLTAETAEKAELIIAEKKTEAINEIATKGAEAVKLITDSKDEALSAISNNTAEAIGEITAKGTQAAQSVENGKNAAVTDIANAKTEALTNIEAEVTKSANNATAAKTSETNAKNAESGAQVAKTAAESAASTATAEANRATQAANEIVQAKDTVPDYVLAEAEETAKKVLNHQSADSFTIAWLSDMHVGHVYKALGWEPDETSVIEAGQGLYELNKECPLDVIALGGDLASGVHNTTRAVGLDQIDKCEKYLRPSTFSIPTLHLRGNHDDAPYQATEGRLTPNDVFQRIGRKNIASGANIVKGKNYGYRDFEAQKMRVIYLDTHDKEGWVSTQFVLNEDDSCPYLNACNVSAAQLDWLANTALNFSDKEAPSEWGIVICSHTQLNIHATPWTYTDETTGISYEANTTNVITILTAYLTKGSGSITLNGETMSYDFSTLTNKAYLYCCINGHNHCEKTYTYGAKGILGIACPAVRDGAERVSADGNTYTKTAGTGNSTSFTVITIDRVHDKIYADIHGAGTDREFDVVVYTNYTNMLDTAYTPPTANNVKPINTSPFNGEGVGYQNGVRLSGWTLSTNADYVVTGIIKWRDAPGDFSGLKPIYIKGANAIFDATDRKYVRCNIIQVNIASSGLYNSKPVEDAADWAETFTIETLGENYYKLTPLESGLSSWHNVRYIQFSLFGKGDNLIITIDEPID